MRIRKGFNLREICGENIVFPEGKENIDFCEIMSLNDVASFLWKNLQDIDFDATTIEKLIKDNYEVDDATAKKDANELFKQMYDAGLLE